MTNPTEPLRNHLRAAINSRRAALRNGRSHRKDHDLLNAAIGRVEAFLTHYPVADDQRVRDYCNTNYRDVALIVPGNQPRALARLVFGALRDSDRSGGEAGPSSDGTHAERGPQGIAQTQRA